MGLLPFLIKNLKVVMVAGSKQELCKLERPSDCGRAGEMVTTFSLLLSSGFLHWGRDFTPSFWQLTFQYLESGGPSCLRPGRVLSTHKLNAGSDAAVTERWLAHLREYFFASQGYDSGRSRTQISWVTDGNLFSLLLIKWIWTRRQKSPNDWVTLLICNVILCPSESITEAHPSLGFLIRLMTSVCSKGQFN